MVYERMKYGQDQRAWVEAANTKLPSLHETAIASQHKARETFDAWQAMPLESQIRMASTFMWLIREANHEALAALNQVLSYEGMRRANS